MVDFEWRDDQLLANLRPKELRNLPDERGPKLDRSAASLDDDAHILGWRGGSGACQRCPLMLDL
jgi:hypothetical protein